LPKQMCVCARRTAAADSIHVTDRGPAHGGRSVKGEDADGRRQESFGYDQQPKAWEAGDGRGLGESEDIVPVLVAQGVWSGPSSASLGSLLPAPPAAKACFPPTWSKVLQPPAVLHSAAHENALCLASSPMIMPWCEPWYRAHRGLGSNLSPHGSSAAVGIMGPWFG